MNSGQFVLSQLLDFIHREVFRRCVQRYGGDYKVRHFSTWQQFVCLAFAQLTWRESLRDIEACLNARASQLYHLGLRQQVRRSTLADALAVRDWRIFAELAQHLIGQARRLYATEPLARELDQTIYALDASIIDLCLSVYPWARFDAARSGVKIHTQLEVHSALPAQLLVSLATFQEVLWLDQLAYEPGAFYLMDRAYLNWLAGADGGATLPATLAGRVVLPVAQATFADQKFLRHQRQRGARATLGSGVHVCAGGDPAQQRGHALRNSPNPECERVRENPDRTTVSSLWFSK